MTNPNQVLNDKSTYRVPASVKDSLGDDFDVSGADITYRMCESRTGELIHEFDQDDDEVDRDYGESHEFLVRIDAWGMDLGHIVVDETARLTIEVDVVDSVVPQVFPRTIRFRDSKIDAPDDPD